MIWCGLLCLSGLATNLYYLMTVFFHHFQLFISIFHCCIYRQIARALTRNADESEDVIDLTFPRKKRIFIDFTEGRYDVGGRRAVQGEGSGNGSGSSSSGSGGDIIKDEVSSDSQTLQTSLGDIDNSGSGSSVSRSVDGNGVNIAKNNAAVDNLQSDTDNNSNSSSSSSSSGSHLDIDISDVYRGGITVFEHFRGELVKCLNEDAVRSQVLSSGGGRGIDKVSYSVRV